ncbi:MAG: DEAD/DEAH box helicase [Bacteroidota bacterium]
MRGLRGKAMSFHAMGFNVVPVAGKEPGVATWKNLMRRTQKAGEVPLLDFEWNYKRDKKITGLGAITGHNDLVCIDFDTVKDFAILTHFLNLLGLPEDYEWVVLSGSGKGFHIWLNCKGNPFSHLPGDSKVYTFNADDKGVFDHLEYRRKQHTVLPFSIHPQTGKPYTFKNVELFPKYSPTYVDPERVLESILEIAQPRHKKEKEYKPTISRNVSDKDTPFDIYNETGRDHFVSQLRACGWKVWTQGKKIFFKHPEASGDDSGNILGNRVQVWSETSCIPPGNYPLTNALAHLLFGGSLSATSKYLREQGFTKTVNFSQEEPTNNKRDKKDPFHFPVEYQEIPFKGKIAEDEAVFTRLESIILSNEKLSIRANTGSGKTYALLQLAKNHATVNNKWIFAFPTQALAEQVATGHGEKAIMQGTDSSDISHAEYSSIIYCTYDSLHKLDVLIPGSTLIFDESHHLVNDASRGFKFKQVNQAFELSGLANHTVLLSGTPCEYFQRLGFHHIYLIEDSPKLLEVEPVYYDEKSYAAVTEALLKDNTEGVKVVFFNSKRKLRSIRRYLIKQRKATSKEIALLISDEKENSETYKSIVHSQRIPEGIKYVLSTKLIADGVNINNENIGSVYLVDIINEEDFVQFPARFRNWKNRKVYSFRKQPTEAKEPKIENVNAFLNSLKNAAQAQKYIISQLDHESCKSTVRSSYSLDGILNSLYYSETEKRYEISDLHLFHVATRERDNTTSAELFYDRISSKYSYVKVMVKSVATSEDQEKIVQVFEDDKEHIASLHEKMYEEVLKDPETVSHAVYDYSQDFKLKKRLGNILADPKAVNLEAEAWKAENPELLTEGIKKPLLNFLTLLESGFTQDQAGKILSRKDLRSDSTFSRFRNQLFMLHALEDETVKLKTAKQELIRKNAIKLKSEIKERWENDRLILTRSEAAEIIKQVQGYYPKRNPGFILSELFIVTTRKADKRKGLEQSFIVSEEKNLSDFLKRFGIDSEEYKDNCAREVHHLHKQKLTI